MSELSLSEIQYLLDTQQAEAAVHQVQMQLEQTPEQMTLWYLLGLALIQLERWGEARAAWESALALDPTHAECHFQLGMLLQTRGETDPALKHLQAARAFCPESENYTQALAQLYLQLGQRENLMLYAQDSLRHHPESATSYYLLGCAFQLYGRFADAEAALRQALFLQPEQVHAAFQLGLLFLELDDRTAAAHWLTHTLTLSVALRPHPSWLARVYALLGQLSQHQGQPGAAAEYWQEALKRWPDFQACTGLALQLPEVYGQSEAIAQWRTHFENGLNTLHDTFAGQTRLREACFEPPYALAYQACDDRELLEKTGHFFQGLFPARPRPAAPEGPQVIVWGHLAPLWQAGALTLLQAWSELESVVVLSSSQHWTAELESRGIRAHWLSPTRASYLEALRQLQPGRLLFSDLRTPLAYTLALERHAPFQAVLCLQPETTGLNTLDAFVSCARLEPEQAQIHYTEPLFQLSHWPILPILPEKTPTPLSRSELGLPQLGHLYFCPAHTVKMHPDLDAVLQTILNQDRRALIYLFAHPASAGASYLAQRLDQTVTHRREKIRFLSCQTPLELIQYLALADVVIDAPWNGARAAALWALGLGVPVVTWEGPWMRGRWAATFNRQLNLTHLNAPTLPELATLAVKTAAEDHWRAILKQELPPQTAQLWNPVGAAEELARFPDLIAKDKQS